MSLLEEVVELSIAAQDKEKNREIIEEYREAVKQAAAGGHTLFFVYEGGCSAQFDAVLCYFQSEGFHVERRWSKNPAAGREATIEWGRQVMNRLVETGQWERRVWVEERVKVES